MQRTDLLDTSLEVHRARIKLLQEKTPEWRIQKVMEMVDQSRLAFPEQTKRAIRKLMDQR